MSDDDKKQEQGPVMSDEQASDAALIDSMVQEQGPPQGDEEGQEQEGEISAELLESQSIMMVDMAASAAEGMHPALKYDKQTRKHVANALTPVLVKYGGQLPPWLARWQEEIGLAIVLAGVGYGNYRAIKEYKEPDKEQEGEKDAA